MSVCLSSALYFSATVPLSLLSPPPQGWPIPAPPKYILSQQRLWGWSSLLKNLVQPNYKVIFIFHVWNDTLLVRFCFSIQHGLVNYCPLTGCIILILHILRTHSALLKALPATLHFPFPVHTENDISGRKVKRRKKKNLISKGDSHSKP